MEIDIRGENLFLTPPLLEQVERRLLLALSRFGESIQRVVVRIAELDNSGCNNQKRCRIVVSLRPSGHMMVECTGPDVRAAIDLGADRLGRSMARKIRLAREIESAHGLSAVRSARTPRR